MPNILGFSFASPWYLLLGPIVLAGLFYAYRRGGQGREVIVSTTFILRDLAGIPKIRQKFWPPPRFFFELLLLLSLTFGAAGISSQKFEERIVVLIDNSFSMAARSNNNGNDKLIDLAVRDAKSYLATLVFDKGTKVCVTSPDLRCLSEAFVSASESANQLKRINFVYSEDRIENALARLLSNDDSSEIVVFSDKSSVDVPSKNARIKLRSSSTLLDKRENVAILGIKSETGSRPGLVKIVATIVGFAEAAHDIAVQVDSLERIGDGYSFNNLGTKNIKLKAGESASVFFEVPSAAAYKVYLSGSGALSFDSISADNAAYISPEVGAGRGFLVSNFTPRELGLDKLRNLSFTHARPGEFKVVSPDVDFVIFHNFVPPEPPQVSSIYINPIGDADLFNVSEEIVRKSDPIVVTSWDEINPITAYIKFHILRLESVTPLIAKKEARAIVQSSAGAVVLSAEFGRFRSVATGFELFPFEPKGNPILSILTLNILKWVSGSGVAGGYTETPFKASAAIGDLTDVLGESKYQEGEWIDSPGVFVRDGNLNSSSGLLAANFFASSESDKYSAQKFVVPGDTATQSDSSEVDKTYAPYLILAALIMTLGDLFVRVYLIVQRRWRVS